MKKIFIVTGELSGDRVAAWYVAQQHAQNPDVYLEGVGGNFLASQGVTLYERFENLNVVGIVEILKHLPRLLRILTTLVDYIANNNFDEVILVDFPGFNLKLAQKLKKLSKKITITYLSPPQVWCWGAWRVKTLQKVCDDIVVLYPFEVDWYAQRGVHVRWIGSPVYDNLEPYFPLIEQKKPLIALLFGSRLSEIKTFTPIIAAVVKTLLLKNPELRFVVPLARSLPEDYVKNHMYAAGLGDSINAFTFVRDEHEKLSLLSQACVALTKPGTVTLELALLNVPSVVFFKTSWGSYAIGKMVVRVSFMALPNLLLGKQLFKEFIQGGCTIDTLSNELERIYKSFLAHDQAYQTTLADCAALRDTLRNVLPT